MEPLFFQNSFSCSMCGMKEDLLHYKFELNAVDEEKSNSINGGFMLCSKHYEMSQDFGLINTCKMMFNDLYKTSKKIDDKETMKFCADILQVFEDNDVNGHIEWKK
jgi:hypothetical protein